MPRHPQSTEPEPVASTLTCGAQVRGRGEYDQLHLEPGEGGADTAKVFSLDPSALDFIWVPTGQLLKNFFNTRKNFK